MEDSPGMVRWLPIWQFFYLLSVGCDEILSGAAEESRCYTGKLLGKYEWK